MGKESAVAGKDVMVFINGKTTALATSCSLSMTASTSEAASKDDGIWENSIVTKLGWELKVESLVGESKTSYNELKTAMKARKPVDIVYGKPSNPNENGVPEDGWKAPTIEYEKGKALITSLERNDPNDSNSTMSATFKGVGELQDVGELQE